MSNQYAAFRKPTGTVYYSPDCYRGGPQYKVGDVINGDECIHHGTLDECQALAIDKDSVSLDEFLRATDA